jgi:D-serine deaminase-like pyridoxal phosphate-dependent protein
MTHAGASYNCFTDEQKTTMAQQERELSLLAATSLREEGIKCPVVSVGSTPTAHFVDDLQGITEVRAGVYVFFDLVMAGLGVCSQDDIAISVLSSIIGHQKDKDWVITDAGWMAMSRDRGTSNHPVDQGYGLVLDVHGSPIDDYIVRSANQEHGILGARHASQNVNFDQFPLASHIRVLPNHACSTAAQFDRFYVVEGDDVVGEWQSISGW